MKLAFGCIFLMVLSCMATANETECSENKIDLPNLEGKTYHEARKTIISKGWKPNQTIFLKLASESPDIQFGNGPLFWKKGYIELESCAGTGMGWCAFSFKKNKMKIQIITIGEESPEDKVYAVVDKQLLLCN